MDSYIKHALRENNIHLQFNHPNIVKCYDAIEIDKMSLCQILEFCEGPTLSFYLKKYKQLPEKEAKSILKQIVSAVKYLHEHKNKVIHYDLKPDNIIWSNGEIKISDFGLCKVMEEDASGCELTSQGVGTYWYLPPETFLVGDQPPQINEKVDIWSIGVMFFEMLYGRRPFGHNMSQERVFKEQIIINSKTVEFPQKPSITSEAKEFIKKCLKYKIEDRWDVIEAYNSSYLNKKEKINQNINIHNYFQQK